MILTVPAAAKRVKRSVRTLERWIAAGDLRTFRVLGARVVRESDLLAVLRAKIRTGPVGVKRHLTRKYGAPK